MIGIQNVGFYAMNLSKTLHCFFTLGTVTTHRALYSLLAILSCHPHVQRALQEEVDRVCGERQPLVADKVNMHYTQAVSINDECFTYCISFQ